MKVNPVIPFLKKHWDQHSPLLLGLSGGPDSMALLHLLVQMRLPLQCAHIDHGMRQEGSIEAEKLQALVKKLGVPFHLQTLRGLTGANLEELFRDERRKFFKELCEKHSFQAVLLAHQADDQAEVILKRVLEGARLYNLGGMQAVSKQEGLTIWRPLLGVRKELLLKFLEEKGIEYFDDHTNRDLHFLRARMREEIFPFLEERFGKQVRGSLLRIGEESVGLKEKLQLAYSLEREGVKLNSDQLEKIFLHLMNRSRNKKFPLNIGELRVDNGEIKLNGRVLKMKFC